MDPSHAEQPQGCAVPFFLPWLLWLLWLAMFAWLIIEVPPIWIWIIFFLPPIFAIYRKVWPPTSPSIDGAPNGNDGPVPPWSGCVWIPVLALIPIVLLIAITVLLTQDDDPLESTTTDDGRTDQPAASIRTDEADVVPAASEPTDNDPDEAVSSTAPPATDATVVSVTDPAPPETTTTLAPAATTTVFLGTPLVPEAVTILEEECATGATEFTMENFLDEVAAAFGPVPGGSPPLETSPPAAIEIEYVGAAVGECDGERRLIVVADLGGPADGIQTSLALDYSPADAGDDGYAADPNSVGGIGQTGGWDQLFPVSEGNLSEFDDNFDSLNLGARYQIQGDVVAWSIPIPPDLGDVNYIVQVFFRNGASDASPIAWSTATGAHVFDR